MGGAEGASNFPMKKLFFLLAAFCLSVSLASADVNPKPFVVPEVTQWTGAEGRLTLSERISVADKALLPMAELLAEDFRLLTGRSFTVVRGKAKTGDIVLKLDKKAGIAKEAYSLSIADKAEATASTTQGLMWATRTLLQIAEQQTDASLPKGKIEDAPQYETRGFMIDVGRKFIPMSYLRNLVKMMAYYKMNLLHIHLNDNGFKQFFGNDWNKTQSAFRLESTTFPGLTATDGSYSKEEFRDLQRLAESLHVEIIPEIDIPAHSLAFTQYKPEIGSKEYGMDHLDLFNPATYEFVDALLKEYLEGDDPVFRGKRMHIGTDEYSNAKKEVVEKFRYFTDRYIKYVESFGKQAVVWGSLSHARGETPVKVDDVLMYVWSNGYSNPKDMKELGYKLVSIPDGYVYIVPAAGYYYDYLNCQWLYENWTPSNVGGHKFEEGDPCIAGGMFAVWNDHCGNGISTKDIHHRTIPALHTLSQKCWTASKTSLPYAAFDSLRHKLSEAPGVNELGRLSKDRKRSIEWGKLEPDTQTGVEEIGYDYSVTFTIDPQPEVRGTVLFESANATFYLSDPVDGKLGFVRDGYRNTFNYKLPNKRVTLSIRGNNRTTQLFADGKKVEELGIQTVHALRPERCLKHNFGTEGKWQPEMYVSSDKMSYVRTLVFPLAKTGKFRSSITNVTIKHGME